MGQSPFSLIQIYASHSNIVNKLTCLITYNFRVNTENRYCLSKMSRYNCTWIWIFWRRCLPPKREKQLKTSNNIIKPTKWRAGQTRFQNKPKTYASKWQIHIFDWQSINLTRDLQTWKMFLYRGQIFWTCHA